MSDVPQQEWVEKAAAVIDGQLSARLNARAALTVVLPDVRRAIAEEIAQAVRGGDCRVVGDAVRIAREVGER